VAACSFFNNVGVPVLIDIRNDNGGNGGNRNRRQTSVPLFIRIKIATAEGVTWCQLRRQ